jgi:Tfp pilus assembly protein PilV
MPGMSVADSIGRMSLRDAARNVRSLADGFSLVEVLVAAGLLATTIVSVVHLFALALRATGDARDTTYATILAAQKIEELRAAVPAEDSSEGVDFLDGQGALLEGVAGAQPTAFTRSWTVERLSATRRRTAIVTVVVSRDGRQARRRHGWHGRDVHLITIVTRNAP